MKKMIVFTLMIGLVLGLVGFANAQNKERPFRFAARGSYLFPTDDNIKGTSNFGLEIQYNFKPNLAVALSGDGIETSIDDSSKGVTGPLDMHNFNISFIGSISKGTEEKTSYFYFGGGATYYLFDIDYTVIDVGKGDDKSTELGFHILAGYELVNNIFGEIRFTQGSVDLKLLEGRTNEMEYSIDLGGLLIVVGYRY